MTPQYVTQKDQAEMGGFINHHFPKFCYVPSEPLHHYTTAENLISILSNGELWATHVSCVNDTKEMHYAIEELHKRVTSRLESNTEPNLSPLLIELSKRLADPGVEIAPFFLACFSECKDDLSQWRAYGGGEGGYSITFDQVKLRASSPTANPMLLRVEYDPKNQKILLDDALQWGEKYFLSWEGRKAAPSIEEWTQDFVGYFLRSMTFFAICIKHPAFAAEKEWRLVFTLENDQQAKAMKFRPKPFMISRHVSLPLSKPLPITGITIGPCRYPRLSQVAVGDLLVSGGYEPNATNIETSIVPYRG
jgi:hypothetical protein